MTRCFGTESPLPSGLAFWVCRWKRTRLRSMSFNCMVQSLSWILRCCSLGQYMPCFFETLNPTVRRSSWIQFIQSRLLFVSLVLLSTRQCLGLSLWPLLKWFYDRNFVFMSNVALLVLLSESHLVPQWPTSRGDNRWWARNFLTGRKCTQTVWDVWQGNPRPTRDLESAGTLGPA